MEKLEQYLKKAGEEGTLGQSLTTLRSRKSWPLEQFTALAEIPAELWERWEDGTAIPSASTLYEVLSRLHWAFWFGDAQHDEREALDDELWDCFNYVRALDTNLIDNDHDLLSRLDDAS